MAYHYSLQIIMCLGMHSRWYMIRPNLLFQSGFLLSGACPLPHSTQVVPNFVPTAPTNGNAFLLASIKGTQGFALFVSSLRSSLNVLAPVGSHCTNFHLWGLHASHLCFAFSWKVNVFSSKIRTGWEDPGRPKKTEKGRAGTCACFTGQRGKMVPAKQIREQGRANWQRAFPVMPVHQSSHLGRVIWGSVNLLFSLEFFFFSHWNS